MKIINYREYLSYLRKTYAAGQDQTILSYAQDMLSSGKKQHMQKQKLQKEINIITAKINTLREELKTSTDKKSISGNIKKLKQAKNQLVQKLKQHSQTTRFSTLSNESKAALCTLVTLRKYLTQELFQNDFHFCAKDDNGNIFFSTETFRRSGLQPEAQHLKDYISAYIIKNPQKVLSEYHFNKLFGKHSNWLEIQKQIDKFFLKQNKALKNKSRAEIIAESHKDIEIIKEYPSNNTILVHLKTPEALDYEGSAAHNCVGGGSYDKLLQEQNSGIYSLRQIAPDNLLIPIATIELQNGNLKQIQGTCNSIIPYHHCQDCRDAVMFLMNTTDIQSLVDNKNISESALNRLGIFRNNNQYLDIYTGINANTIFVPDLRISSQEISDYNWENITINQLTITDNITNKNITELKKFSNVQNVKLPNISENLSLDLSSFNKLQSLSLNSNTNAEINLHGQNNHITTLSLHNVILQNTSFDNLPNLESISFCNMDLSQLTLKPETKAIYDKCTISTQIFKNFISITNIDYYTTTSAETNKVIGEYIDLSDLTENVYLDDFEFVNLKEIRFAPHIKKAAFSALKNIDNTKITGLKNVDNLFISEQDTILEMINPQSLQVLDYRHSNPYTHFDLSIFTNLKKLTCPHYSISKIPPNVEDLTINSNSLLFWDNNHQLRVPDKDETPLDLRHLHKLKNLYTTGITSDFSGILAPDNVETMRIQTLESIKELDFSNCYKLKTLDLFGLSKEMNKIILPSSIKNLNAPYSAVGFGIHTAENYPRKKIDFILPQNSNKNVIEYLQHFWGNECIHLTPTLPIKQNLLLPSRDI